MKITNVVVRDIRFPTSAQQDGSDALNLGDYSATYVVLETNGGLEGQGLTFTNGRGNEIVVAAVHALKHHVVGKRLDGPYRPGDRTADWFKVKTEKDADFVVVGYTRGEGGRSRMGALDVASFDDAGELVLRGRVGSGLTERAIDKLLPLLDAIASKTPTSRGTYEPKVRVHVAPRYVVRVRYLGWSSDGKLRFPVFRGLRDDVPPGECREAPAAATPKACP